MAAARLPIMNDILFSSFQQMGFTIGRIVVHTVLQMDPADLDDPAGR